MKYLLFTAIILSLFSCKTEKMINNPVKSVTELGLVPQPQIVKLQKGTFVFNKKTDFLLPKKTDERILKFIKLNFPENKMKLSDTENINPENTVFFSFINSDTLTNSELYFLDISQKNIQIKAKSDTGFFYALQTLLQILPNKITETNVLPALSIFDEPQFKWRGAHLDVCRHFFDTEFVKKYIDLLAIHKMNKFHWHLTEDQGWRIEIKKYPKLTETGSKRKETVIKKNFNPYIGDGKEYGGFYTQEEIKEIVAYANDRFITVIPEIEMPGHSSAALAAYPYLSCTGGPFEVKTKWGIFKDIYCAGNDSVYIFLQNVLDEVTELFPSKYIHIGGDEAPKDRWKECPKCQARIKKEGLKNEHELQSYFIRRIEKYLNAKGRTIIGWDEILEGGLAPNAVVMSWRGEAGGIKAANQNHYVIMTPGNPCYFDHYQSKNRENEPFAIGGYNPLKAVYEYNPVPEELPEEKQKYILGSQANVWTEYISTNRQVEYMVFPRLCALSEVVWTGDKKTGYEDFKSRLRNKHFSRLQNMNVNYRKLTDED